MGPDVQACAVLIVVVVMLPQTRHASLPFSLPMKL